jgi:hypothetical protein
MKVLCILFLIIEIFSVVSAINWQTNFFNLFKLRQILVLAMIQAK